MNDIEILEEFKSRTILYSDVYAIQIEELKKIQQAIENILKERQADKEKIKKQSTEITTYKHLYEETKRDFEYYKNDKDINYLDNNHHKLLVEKSLGQTIDKPEDCWFDIFEVKIIRNNMLYGVAINDDFVTLKQISDEHPEDCITVIAESPLSGAIYRYNNYNDKKWQLIGNMIGYA